MSKNVVTLKSGQRSLRVIESCTITVTMYHSVDRVWFPISVLL